MPTRQGVGTGRIVQTRAYTCRTCRVVGSATARAASSQASAATIGTYDESVLPTGIRSRMRGVHFVEGAGHWVQQEQAEVVARLLTAFVQQRA